MRRGATNGVGMLGGLFVAVLAAAGCDDDEQSSGDGRKGGAGEQSIDTRGEPVDPPFEVKGDCEGLLLAWFDERGVHTAQGREAVPKEHRERVRVDSLSLPPDERLGPEWVYVADLSEPGEDGEYPVRKMRRAAFDALVDAEKSGESDSEKRAARVGGGPSTSGDADVVIYGAEWCKACDEAALFFESHGVPYVEKDIEENPDALAEMQRKAKGAGMRPSGVPVIDYKGTLIQGFNRQRLQKLINQGAQPI